MKQRNNRKTWLAWLIGAGLSTAMLAACWLLLDCRYACNDDTPIVRELMGFDCLQPPDFNFLLHAVLLYPLRWISAAFPGVAWFSWMQIAFVWFAGALGVKALVGCFQKNGRSPWWGALAGACWLTAFALAYAARMTFTQTAAMLGAAAVLQVLSIDARRDSDGQVLRGLLMALVPVVLAYGLRQITALPILAFCAAAFLYQTLRGFGLGKAAKRPLKPLVCFLLVGGVLFGALVGGRELEIRAKGKQDFLRWQRARASVMDYGGLDNLSDELLEKLGWSRAKIEMLDSWYFLDSDITAEAFETIAAYNAAQRTGGLWARVKDSAALLAGFRQREPIAWRSLGVLAAAGVLCALALLLRRRDALWQWLCLAAGALLAVLLLLYLGLNGRVPLRAALMVVLPFAAMVFGLAADCLPPKGEARAPGRAALCIAALCVVTATVGYAAPAVREYRKTPPEEYTEADLINPFQDLDELAAQDPDCLIFYDMTFASDTRVFPSTEYGTPANVMFWGGWGARSPEYMERLAAFGIDGNDLDASVFLRDDVYLARGVVDTEPSDLLQHIAETTGQAVYFQYETEWGGVHLGKVYAEE